jgi:hypothetical protein
LVARAATWDEPVVLKLLLRESCYSGERGDVIETRRLAAAIRADEKV